MHPAAAKVIATLSNEWDGLAATRTCRSCRWTTTPRNEHCGPGDRPQELLRLRGRMGRSWPPMVWTVTATAARHDIESLGLLTGYLQACGNGGTAPAQPGPSPWTPGPAAARQ